MIFLFTGTVFDFFWKTEMTSQMAVPNIINLVSNLEIPIVKNKVALRNGILDSAYGL